MMSLRLRVALSSAAVAAAALGVGLATVWGVAGREIAARHAAELIAQATVLAPQALASVRLGPGGPGGPGPGADGFLERAQDTGVEVLVVAQGGGVLVRSGRWPPGLGPERLGFPAQPGAGEGPLVERGRRGPPGPGGGPPPRLGPPEVREVREADRPGRRWLLAVIEAPGAWVVVGRPRDRMDAERWALGRALLLAFPAGVVLSAFGAAWAAGAAVRPVRRLTALMERVSSESMAERLPERDAPEEFARAIGTFNAMLDRLEAGLRQARRFSADAAHELNTPLTVLLAQLGDAVQQATPGGAEQARLAECLEEAQRLAGIVARLLLLAKAESGTLRLERTRFDLGALVADVLADVAATHPELACAHAGEGVWIEADAGLVRQCVTNLLVNAAKYNRPGGAVAVEVRAVDGGAAELDVTNTGAPIPAEHVPHLFNRFHRPDGVRARETGGAGLGLSLAREFARAHGGTLELASNGPDAIKFTLRLPRAGGC